MGILSSHPMRCRNCPKALPMLPFRLYTGATANATPPSPKKVKISFRPVSGGFKTNGKAPCPRAAVRPQALTAALLCPKHSGKDTPGAEKGEEPDKKPASGPHGGAVDVPLHRIQRYHWSGKASQRPPDIPCAPYCVGGHLFLCPKNGTQEIAGTAIPAARPLPVPWLLPCQFR